MDKLKKILFVASKKEASLRSGKLVCNKPAADLINKLESRVFRLEKETVRLASILNCNSDAKGLAVFKRVTPCCCVEAEMLQRDDLIERLQKENGILRKQKLLKERS